MTRRAIILVLDGVGIGEAPDAARYGDVGSDTLGNLARAVGGLRLPNLERAGLGNIAPLDGVPPADRPLGAWGLMVPASTGKDSTTGHWEIAGVHLARPFPTYPHGFPAELIAEFARRTGRGVIGNVVASGTAVLDAYGPEHQRTGAWIVYTSADSVFQVAAHEEVVPLAELHRACAVARELLVAPHDLSRVIARPFVGRPGAYERTAHRRDFSIAPPAETLLDALERAGVPRAGVGKVDDLFAGRGIRSRHTGSNAEGIAAIAEWIDSAAGGLLFANLVDFDQKFGHRNDIPGFHEALREFDGALAGYISALREDDLLFITADHGNDPTTPSTDHARECVPLLVLGGGTEWGRSGDGVGRRNPLRDNAGTAPAGGRVAPVALGRRPTFSDLGATVAEWLGSPFRGRGTSFLPALLAR